ncbi:MAG TPA: DUF2306 domain-containing protein [Acidimicrobiia bacterium]
MSLILIVFVFVVVRVTTDVPAILDGSSPPEADFGRRYADNPVIAYAHIIPGVIYLLGAPFQLSSRFRNSDFARHRRLGRVVLTAGAITGAFALVVGLVMPFGGLAEASASTVFGVYFLVALGTAYSAIRSGDTGRHRRWMIRAFALGIAVGLIRVVVGLVESFGVTMADSFGAAFWIAFVVMAIMAEIWLRLRPTADIVPRIKVRRGDAEPS